jgi:hypothetical protein
MKNQIAPAFRVTATISFCLAALFFSSASAQTVTLNENFDSNLGYFRIQQNNGINGNQLGWDSTANAGGSAGELSGTLARTHNLAPAYVGSKLYGTLSSTNDIVLSGKLFLYNFNFDGSLFIAMVDTNNLSGSKLGLQVSEPGGGSGTFFRGQASGPNCNSGQILLPDLQAIDFNLVWSAVTNRLTGTVWTNVISVAGSPGATYNALVVGAWGASSASQNHQTAIYVDSLMFTSLPPPPLEVALTNPPSGSSIFAGGGVQLDAWAVANTGTVSKVEFYARLTNSPTASKVGEATFEPYGASWSSVPAGVYWLTAVAYNNLANSVTSAPVLFTATTQPTLSVALTAPLNVSPNYYTDGAFVVAEGVYHPFGGTNTGVPVVTVTATNALNTGLVTNVSFYVQKGGNTISKIGEALTPTNLVEFSIEWTNPPAGSYLLTARSYSDAGVSATSAPIRFYVLVPRPTMLVTNTFAGGPGRWTDTQRNNTNGNSFYWTNSNTAGGGAAGEIFALVAGASFTQEAWIGDNHLNGWLQPSFQSLRFKGRVYLENINFGDAFLLGFHNSRRPGDILSIAHGLTGDPLSTGFPAVVGSWSASAAFLMPKTTSIPFDLTWSCTNNTYTGTVGSSVINHTDSPPMAFNRAFDTVSILTTWGSVNPTRQCKIWMDDVTYNVVVPPSLNITTSGSQLLISWQGAGYVLQSRASLTSGNWMDRTETPAQTGDTFSVTLSAPASPIFFRLIW